MRISHRFRRRALGITTVVLFMGGFLVFGLLLRQVPSKRPTVPVSAQYGSGPYWRSDFEGTDFAGTKLGIAGTWMGAVSGVPSTPSATCATGPASPPNPLEVKTGTASQGTSALHVYLRPIDQPAPGDCDKHKSRAEMTQADKTGNQDQVGVARTKSKQGNTGYYRFAYYLPSDANLNPDNFNIVSQFHALGTGDNPNVSLDFRPDASGTYDLVLHAHGGTLFSTAPGTDLTQTLGGKARPNTWVEVIVGVYWNPAPNGGWVEAYRRDGLAGSWQSVLNRTPNATLYTENGVTIDSYLKVGLYRGSANGSTIFNQVSHVIIDDIRAGDTLESVRDEAPPPPCTTCNTPPPASGSNPKPTPVSGTTGTKPGTPITNSNGQAGTANTDLNGDGAVTQQEAAAASSAASSAATQQSKVLQSNNAHRNHLRLASALLFLSGFLILGGLWLYFVKGRLHHYANEVQKYHDASPPSLFHPTTSG